MSGRGRQESLEGDEGSERADEAADRQWLAARERGEAELPPLAAARVADYHALGKALEELPEHSAPEGWNAAVLAEAERMDAAARRQGRGSSPAIGRDRPIAVDPFDASEVSTERERVELAAQRTKTWVADGSQPSLSLEEPAPAAAEPPVELAPVSPTRSFATARSPRRRLALAALGCAALAAAVAVWMITNRRPEARRAPAVAMALPPSASLGELSTRVELGQQRSAARGGAVATGDVFFAELKLASGKLGELRLYRDDREVVARCATQDRGCAAVDGADGVDGVGDVGGVTLQLRFLFAAPGSYRLVYVEGGELTAPGGGLNRDLDSCVACRVRLEAPFPVQ